MHLTIDLFGGKKKKKVYTTKKKSKHHHKSEKLHALKFYNVDKSGKIQRTRKECPKCGPGFIIIFFFFSKRINFWILVAFLWQNI